MIQLRHLPSDTTHLIISCGGNDALQNVGQLLEPVTDAGETFDLFGNPAEFSTNLHPDAL